MVKEAAEHYGKFLTALGCDWQNDPNSMETPWRVAKAYVNDLWKGRYELPSDITAFPSDGYRGIILEKDISVGTWEDFMKCYGNREMASEVDNIGRRFWYDPKWKRND